jgi:AGZA family xanthine/uracil permease-like MFS transporter
MNDKPIKYHWFVLGDFNGFFGLMFDNLTVLSFLSGILVFAFGFPADIIYTRMIPGTALGVLFGDFVYTWLAFRLAKKSGSATVTAMPLGLDTPSTIGIALVVLGPCFLAMKAKGIGEREAAMMTWYVGMATMVMIGILKLVMSFAGQWVQKIVPQAGLLGSIAGIGLALIGFVPLVDIFGMPIIGLIALGLVFYTLVAEIPLPKNVPGVLAAVVVGTAIYYLAGLFGFPSGVTITAPQAELHAGLPLPTLDFFAGFGPAMTYLPIAIPFGILTVVGGINVTESARVAGDDYSTRDILLTEAVATLLAGVTGGVAQSTPYIGQPAYKRMGSRAGYTLMTGLFIGIGGMLGLVSFVIELIPRAVLAPILVFVAIDIIVQAFQASPARHAPAVAFAFFPTVARLLAIKLGNPDAVPPANFTRLLQGTGNGLSELMVTVALGNGFIVTAMLWGGFLAKLIDRRMKAAATFLLVLAGLTLFGVIHSASPDGLMYFPWDLPEAVARVPYQFAGAYAILAVLLIVLSYTRQFTDGKLQEPERVSV